ncbi:HNH endonuclease [Mycobacterium phage PhelpsODU]|uniref:HNH endonuclease n=1 Tax=Mycobacterium phage Unicorn TaxID=2015825 RepID=A0A222ZKU3_9CAUD|nr:HNH endonuclease [Mycobacterium phage Unicorn]ASR85078.1 HNH endonuclease [Mycobacterium phage Unicorn]ASR85178.1 HNH endonuclease [Mycobacterium phage PhelpsODU]
MAANARLFDRIALSRADGRCECEGDCGRSHRFGIHDRCGNIHGRPALHGADRVVSLQVVPLDGNDRNLADRNVIAFCQACLKRHRAKLKAAAEKRAEREAVEAQHSALFDLTADDAPRPSGLTL